MRDQLTDEMLTQAAKQVAASMKASLPVPEECHHDFPPEFERDMKRLATQTERRRHMRRYLQRVAAACLAVVISLSTWLAVDAEPGPPSSSGSRPFMSSLWFTSSSIQVRRRMKLVTCSVGCQMVTPWKRGGWRNHYHAHLSQRRRCYLLYLRTGNGWRSDQAIH